MIMTFLHKFILASIILIVPNDYKPVYSNKQRIIDFSKDIEASIENNPQYILFDGNDKKFVMATILVAIAWRESGFRQDIQTCVVKGDNNRSITSFQIMKPWALSKKVEIIRNINNEKIIYYKWKKHFSESELCNSVELASEQAMQMFSLNQSLCTYGAPRNYFAGYGSGNCKNPLKVTDNLCYMWYNLSKKTGLEGANCYKNKEIKFVNKEKTNEKISKIVNSYLNG